MMPNFEENFDFDTSPFEQYVAENEPEILNYAVVPPYFDVAKRRAATPSTHILFGARGAGKSATRLSTERELWNRHSDGARVPLPVPMVNFSRVLDNKKVEDVTSDDLIRELSFCVIEALLLWVSDQEEGAAYIELLDTDELANLIALVDEFYFSVPEGERRLSHDSAMRILHQNWKSRTRNWGMKKWAAVSRIIAEISSGLAKKYAETRDLTKEISELLVRDGQITSRVTVLTKLVEAVRIFGFTGISVFVDKVDEHPKTQSSAESAARLVHPLLSHVQLMEVDGLGWQFFLWDRIQPFFRGGPLEIRLDKIAHSEVAWTGDFLRSMLDARVEFFSSRKITSILDLADSDFDRSTKIGEAIDLAVSSPRELIRLFDTVAREFDANHTWSSEKRLLVEGDFDAGMDNYVSDVIWGVYEKDVLSQIIRLGKIKFINKEVQSAFKLSAPGATNRIGKWENSGAVSLTGKREAEGGAGGKPSNEYSVNDPRITRLVTRGLYDERNLTEAPIEGDHPV